MYREDGAMVIGFAREDSFGLKTFYYSFWCRLEIFYVLSFIAVVSAP